MARYVIAGVLALEALVLVMSLTHERTSRREEQDRLSSDPIPDVWSKENLGQAINRPAVFDARDAKIGPDDIVIGVTVAGRARAYRLDAFQKPSGHLVNDLIGEAPVSVVYCNLTDCARVYTDPQWSGPLPIEVAGLLNKEMVIETGGIFYYQKSGRVVRPGESPAAIPFRLLAPTRTTWREWAREHPDTEVYVGDPKDPRG